MKEALPQMIFIAVLVINFLTSLIDSNRNSKASLIATIILVALTYWGGFYKPLIDFLTAKIQQTEVPKEAQDKGTEVRWLGLAGANPGYT